MKFSWTRKEQGQRKILGVSFGSDAGSYPVCMGLIAVDKCAVMNTLLVITATDITSSLVASASYSTPMSRPIWAQFSRNCQNSCKLSDSNDSSGLTLHNFAPKFAFWSNSVDTVFCDCRVSAR